MDMNELKQFGKMLRNVCEHLEKTAAPWNTSQAMMRAIAGGIAGAGAGNLAGRAYDSSDPSARLWGTLGGGALGAAAGGLLGMPVNYRHYSDAGRALSSGFGTRAVAAGLGGIAGGAAANTLADNSNGTDWGTLALGTGGGALLGLGAATAGGQALSRWGNQGMRRTLAEAAGENMGQFSRTMGRGLSARHPQMGTVFTELSHADPNSLAATGSMLEAAGGLSGRNLENLYNQVHGLQFAGNAAGAGQAAARALGGHAAGAMRNVGDVANLARTHGIQLQSQLPAWQRAATNWFGPNGADTVRNAAMAGAGYMGLRAAGNVYNDFFGGRRNQGGFAIVPQ